MAVLPGVLLLGGCVVPETPREADSAPVRTTPVAVVTAPTNGQAVVKIQRVPLLNSPRRIREEYVYPEPYTRQDFVWTMGPGEWHLRLTPQRYGYGGIVFMRPYDLSSMRADGVLQFRLKPANMAHYLSVAFIDGNLRAPRVLTDMALTEDGGPQGTDWATFRIALAAFPRSGLAVEDSDPGETYPFDWSDVEEMRFVTDGHNMPNQEVVITQFLITR